MVSGAHYAAGQNLGASQLSSTTREVCYVKGSTDTLILRCKFYHVAENATPMLNANMRSIITSKAQAAAARGLRVLAIAWASIQVVTDV